MALLDDIGQYLTDQGIVGGATGWTLQKGTITTQPDKVVALFRTPGLPPEDRVDMDQPGFQVRVRGEQEDYAPAEAKLLAIQAVLHPLSGTLSGTYYVSILAAGSPMPLGLDANNRPELVQNYRCRVSR